MKKAIWMGALAAGLLVLAGCDLLLKPSFAVEGNYTGTWDLAIDIPGADASAQQCTVQAQLDKIESGGMMGLSKVSGVITFYFDCIQTPIPINIQPLALPVEGRILPGGLLELNSADLAAECGQDVCLKVVLGVHGKDENIDGVMDMFSGGWTGLISGNLIEQLVGGQVDVSQGVPVAGSLTASRN